MNENLTQKERLEYRVEEFTADSVEYKDFAIPRDIDGRQRLLRSLMNIRMPGRISPKVIKIQDEYLIERSKEKGIVTLADIPAVSEQYGSESPFADRLSIWQGDITRLAVDAIVNAANSQMLGCFVPMHTCIDNCIHTFAGIQLREECNRRMKELRNRYGQDYQQPTGIPMLTDAYNLPAKKVVHIVGPIVYGGLTPELEKNLEDCYKNTLEICLENGLRTVAFCCISTGVFHFPNKRAAEIAVTAVTSWLAEHQEAMDRVIFNVFKDEDKEYYKGILSGVFGSCR